MQERLDRCIVVITSDNDVASSCYSVAIKVRQLIMVAGKTMESKPSRCSWMMLVGVWSVVALALVVIHCATVVQVQTMRTDIARIQRQMQQQQQQQRGCDAIPAPCEHTSSRVSTYRSSPQRRAQAAIPPILDLTTDAEYVANECRYLVVNVQQCSFLHG